MYVPGDSPLGHPNRGNFPQNRHRLNTRPGRLPAAGAIPAPPGGEVAQENSVRGDVEVWEANAGTLSTVSVTADRCGFRLPDSPDRGGLQERHRHRRSRHLLLRERRPDGNHHHDSSQVPCVGRRLQPRTATSRTVGAGQRLANQVKAHSTTSWVQTTTTPTLAARHQRHDQQHGATTDPYDLILVEIL